MDWNWPRLVNTCGRPNSGNGQYWAAASKRGEVRVWEEEGHTLRWNWQAHTDTTYALAFNPDGRTLVSGSWDDTIKLWDLEHGALLWSAWHPAGALCVAFAPDGSLLASGGNDAILRLWDLQSSLPLQKLPHPGPILSLAWTRMGTCSPVEARQERFGCGRYRRASRPPALRS